MIPSVKDKTADVEDVPEIRAWRLKHRGWYLVFDLTMLAGFFATTMILLRLFHGAFGKDFACSALVGITGCAVGTVIAVVITPLTAEERRGWTTLTSALVGVIAGYGIKVVDELVAYLVKAGHFLDPILGLRFATFILCMLTSLAFGFSYRRYYVTLDLEFVPGSITHGDGEAGASTSGRPPGRSPDVAVARDADHR
jgi:hypothetical protein